MADLSIQTKNVTGIIQFKGYEFFEMPFDAFRDWLNENTRRYGFALHDMDLANDGDCVNPHFQFVFELVKTARLSTTLNKIATVCGVNGFAVTLDKFTSFLGSFQYVLHRNRPEKYQYEDDRLFTNIPKDEVFILMHQKSFVLDFDHLWELVAHAKSKTEIVQVMGPHLYKHHRATIMDIWYETHTPNGSVSGPDVEIIAERLRNNKEMNLSFTNN